MMEATQLGIHGIKKTYSAGRVAVHALSGIDYNLGPGIHALLGPNGAGKSTLINIVTGSLKPTMGYVSWNHLDIARQGAKFRMNLGYMPQQQTLYPSFTGRRFLEYFCTLKGIPRKEIPDEVSRVASYVNLEAHLNKKIGTYSGGMKQRLLAAVTITGNPALIVLDEPTAGLDPKERVRFRNLVHSLGEKRIILFATHVVSDIEEIADNVIFLKNGSIPAAGPTQELLDRYQCSNLEEVYLNIFGEE